MFHWPSGEWPPFLTNQNLEQCQAVSPWVLVVQIAGYMFIRFELKLIYGKDYP